MASPGSRMLVPPAPRKQDIRAPIQPMGSVWQSQSNQEDEACALGSACDDGWIKNLTPAKPSAAMTARLEPKRTQPQPEMHEELQQPQKCKQQEPQQQQQQPQRDPMREELERLQSENQFIKLKLNEANLQHEQQIRLLNAQLQQIRAERDQALQRMNDELQQWKKAHAHAVENARQARGDFQAQLAEVQRTATSVRERWPSKAPTPFSFNTSLPIGQCKPVVYSTAPSVQSPSNPQSRQLKTHLVNVASIAAPNGQATPMKIAPQNPYQWRNTPLPSPALPSAQSHLAPPPTPYKTSPFGSNNNEQYAVLPQLHAPQCVPSQTVGTPSKTEPGLPEMGQSNQSPQSKKPSGGIISYCTDFLAASFTPVITAASSPSANANAKVAPAWYRFSRGPVVMPDEFDPEIGRVQFNTPASFDGIQANTTAQSFATHAPYQHSKQTTVLPVHAMASF